MIQAPVEEFKATPRPANCSLWIQCFLHHHKNRNVTKGELMEAAITRLYSRDQIYEAMKSLRNTPNIAIFWESKDRTEYWRWIDMTQEEFDKHLDDIRWFDSLPG